MVMRLLLLGLLFFFNACSNKSSSDIHKDESMELGLLMREMNMVIDDRYKSELERDDARYRYAKRIAQNIETFTIGVKKKDKKHLSKYVNSQNEAIFYKYIDQLEQNANSIDSIVKNYEIEKLDNAIVGLKNTCIDCHIDLGVKHAIIGH